MGAICYLDEIIEARHDTTIVTHPLTDHRHTLPLDRKDELVHAHPDFQPVISYNPGYQSLIKDLKQSTKQRFVGRDLDYPSADIKTGIVQQETGVDSDITTQLVKMAEMARNLKGHGNGRRHFYPLAGLRGTTNQAWCRPCCLSHSAEASDH